MATEDKDTERFTAIHNATMSLLNAIKRCSDRAASGSVASPQGDNQYAMAANNLASALESVRGKR
jgi:hypothetical protein